MTWDDFLDRGGPCNECGEPVDEDHHAYCADCFREQMGWKPSSMPAQRTEPHESYIEAIVDLRRRVSELEARLHSLEERTRLP